MKKQLLISILILVFLSLGTIIAILYAKGYGISFNQGKPELSGTGLLVVTSNPDGAEVLIDGHLTTATNNTINLLPGSYNVEIQKEGYYPWDKTIVIKKEVVNKANAYLLPKAPPLQSLTDLGVLNPAIDPTFSKIAYTVSSQSASTNGIYIFDMSASNIIAPEGSQTQIADDSNIPFSNAQLSWSPDGTNLIATVSGSTYLLKTSGFNNNPSDVTITLADLENTWNKQITQKQKDQFSTLNTKLKPVVSSDFKILAFSPDNTKILYVASLSATLPPIITPPLMGVDSTTEKRNIISGKVYVYDIKEDRNYEIDFSNNPTTDVNSAINSPVPTQSEPTAKVSESLPIRWLSDSSHLVMIENKKIEIAEYDGSNKTTVYAGPFVDSFVYSWPDGSKLVMLTNLGNDQITPNLYTIGLQ